MAELLVIGANRDVLQEFYENFGGNVFLCHQAIDMLLQQFRMSEERLFDPFSVQSNDGLGDLDGTVEGETESQQGARFIAKRNFGAIIDKKTTTFLDQALKEEMFRDPNVVRVLFPPTTYARRCMQRMVETVKSSALDVFNANSEFRSN